MRKQPHIFSQPFRKTYRHHVSPRLQYLRRAKKEKTKAARRALRQQNTLERRRPDFEERTGGGVRSAVWTVVARRSHPEFVWDLEGRTP